MATVVDLTGESSPKRARTDRVFHVHRISNNGSTYSQDVLIVGPVDEWKHAATHLRETMHQLCVDTCAMWKQRPIVILAHFLEADNEISVSVPAMGDDSACALRERWAELLSYCPADAPSGDEDAPAPIQDEEYDDKFVFSKFPRAMTPDMPNDIFVVVTSVDSV